MKAATIGVNQMTFEELAERWEPKIRNILQRYEVSAYDKDDLRQECLIVLNRCKHGYDPTVVGPVSGKTAKFGTYYHRALMNHFGHLRLKVKVHNPPMEISLNQMAEIHSLDVGSVRMGQTHRALLEATTEEDATDVSDFWMDLEQVGLTPQELGVVKGRINQMTFKALGEKYGITRGKVRVTILHARDKLAARR